jgi:hypothetical protein
MSRIAAVSMACIVAGAIVFMVILYAVASKGSEQTGDFQRVIVPGFLQPIQALELGENHYVAGDANGHYLIADQTALTLIETDGALKILDTVLIKVHDTVRLQRPILELDSPFFYIKDGALPGIFKGRIGEWKAEQILEDCPYFSWAVAMADEQFAIQATVSIEGDSLQKNILGLASEDGFTPNVDVLASKEPKDIFDSRGVLRYSRLLGRLVYTHFYRCTSLVLDSSLHLLYEFNTIDNIAQARTKSIEVNEGVYTMAAPMAVVNNNTQVSDNVLYVHSNVRGANEDERDFSSNSVIDVYDLRNGKYLYSFYIPFYKSEKTTTFKVLENRLLVKYGKNIILYSPGGKPGA